jgi:hypothetical protein
MNFINNQLKIIDDPDFGCTIVFSDTIENYDENITSADQLTSNKKYLLIQRSYPEDEYEIDWYTVETTESDVGLSPKDNIIIKLKRETFEISWSGEKLTIGLNLSDKEYLKLDKILRKRFKDRMIFIK